MKFEHIEKMTEEFESLQCGDLNGKEGEELYLWWNLRITLAIAQQLSVISSSLKKEE